jgi:hypothetical protein
MSVPFAIVTERPISMFVIVLLVNKVNRREYFREPSDFSTQCCHRTESPPFFILREFRKWTAELDDKGFRGSVEG